MALTQEQLLNALKEIKDPYTGLDYVSSKSIKNVAIDPARVAFSLELAYPAKSLWDKLRGELTRAVQE